jgi:hypothetical protein
MAVDVLAKLFACGGFEEQANLCTPILLRKKAEKPLLCDVHPPLT